MHHWSYILQRGLDAQAWSQLLTYTPLAVLLNVRKQLSWLKWSALVSIANHNEILWFHECQSFKTCKVFFNYLPDIKWHNAFKPDNSSLKWPNIHGVSQGWLQSFMTLSAVQRWALPQAQMFLSKPIPSFKENLVPVWTPWPNLDCCTWVSTCSKTCVFMEVWKKPVLDLVVFALFFEIWNHILRSAYPTVSLKWIKNWPELPNCKLNRTT